MPPERNSTRPTSAPPGEEDDRHKESKSYANFLKETERKCGPDGFLDSARYTSRCMQKRQKQGPRSLDKSSTPRVLDVSTNRLEYEKEYEKRVKAIEDSMWQAKQEERELERFKRDVMKKQRDVRQLMKSAEQDAAKQRFGEDKKLNKSLEKYTTLQRNFSQQKIERSQSRAEVNRSFLQNEKDQGRATQLNTTHLMREYRENMDSLRLCKSEADRLVRDYETKLRLLESKQLTLKKNMEDLSNKMYRETLKGKQLRMANEKERKNARDRNIKDDLQGEADLDKKLTRGDGDVKAATMQKRRLSANLNTMRSHMAIRKREEDRTLQSTRIRLEDNTNVQQKLNRESKFSENNLKAKEMEQRIEEANARRINAENVRQLNRKKQRTSQESFFNERAKERHLETTRLRHEDSLRHFRRSVSYGENVEHQLHNQVKQAEYLRQKHEQELRKIQQKLKDLKKSNAQRITTEMAEANRREKALEETLLREKAELDKAHAQREESYTALLQHRVTLKEEKQLLQRFSKESDRLLQIGTRTDAVAAQ